MPHADPAARQAYNREYKRRNRARFRPRQKLYDAAAHANERARKHGAPGTLTPEDVAEVLAAGRCHYCGATESSPWWTIDHVVGLHLGGPNRPGNLVCCCHPCNASKHQAEAPGKWARAADRCASCGGTDSPHAARGYCRRCYQRLSRQTDTLRAPARPRESTA